MRTKKEKKPKAYIRPEYLKGNLPDGNPFGLKRETYCFDRNSREFKQMTGIMVEFSKQKRSAPVSSKITF